MSKEHAYAYEAGYRDGSTNYELEHCPACKNVADLQDALVENAELRELCAGMLAHMRSDGCEGCVAKFACNAGELEECVEVLDFARRMAALGIEVDE